MFAMGRSALVNGTAVVGPDSKITKNHKYYLKNTGDVDKGITQGDATEKGLGVYTTSLVQAENREIGSVDPQVLIRYFRLNTALGFLLFAGLTLSLMCYACSKSMVNVVLNWWTSDRF